MRNVKYKGCQDTGWGKTSQLLWDTLKNQANLEELAIGRHFSEVNPLATAVRNWSLWNNDADVLALASQVLREK